MVGIVIVGHAGTSTAIAEAAEMILGEQTQLQTVNLHHDTNLDAFADALSSFVEGVDSGDGVLVLCDLLGGSPANTASASIRQGAEVVTGFNLPMVLEVLVNRSSCTAQELAQVAVQAGASGIVNIRTLLTGEENQ